MEVFLHRFRRYGRITRWSPTRPTSLSSLVAQCYRAPGTLAVFILVLDRLSSGLSSNLGLHFPSLVNLCLRFLHSHRLSPVASSVGLHSYARVCNLLYSSQTIKPAISGHAMVSIRISAKKSGADTAVQWKQLVSIYYHMTAKCQVRPRIQNISRAHVP